MGPTGEAHGNRSPLKRLFQLSSTCAAANNPAMRLIALEIVAVISHEHRTGKTIQPQDALTSDPSRLGAGLDKYPQDLKCLSSHPKIQGVTV